MEAGRNGGISRRQLVDLLVFLFVAGYDTSKNVMTYMMHTMISNPEIYSGVRQTLSIAASASRRCSGSTTPEPPSASPPPTWSFATYACRRTRWCSSP